MTDPMQSTPPDQAEALANADAATDQESAPIGKRRAYVLAGAGAAAMAVVITTTLLIAGSQPPPEAAHDTRTETPFETARGRCGTAVPNGARVGDEGASLTLRSAGEKSEGLTFDQLECYWSMLKMPDSVRAEVGATRALDGRRSADWDGIRASWSYHPDSGVQMVFTLAD